MTEDGQEEEKAVRCDQGREGGFAGEHWRGSGYEARSDEERNGAEVQANVGEVARGRWLGPLNGRA